MEVIKTMLQKMGHSVSVAWNGSECLEQLFDSAGVLVLIAKLARNAPGGLAQAKRRMGHALRRHRAALALQTAARGRLGRRLAAGRRAEAPPPHRQRKADLPGAFSSEYKGGLTRVTEQLFEGQGLY